MISKKIKLMIAKIPEEAIHILKISGAVKNSEETYVRARATLDVLDIAVRMLISEIETVKARKTK